MFLGYEIKAQQNQAKPLVLETDIKISQAVLDPSKGGKKDPVCLMAEYNKKQFILAVLDPTRSWQCPLDLMFAAGSEVKFFIKGSGTVHLTGYEYRDDIGSDLEFDTSSEEEEEDVNQVEEPKTAKKNGTKAVVKGAKTNGVKKPGVKKEDVKKSSDGHKQDSDEDDDSDDEDFDSDMMDQDDDIEMSEEDEDLDSEGLEDEDLEDEDEESEADED